MGSVDIYVNERIKWPHEFVLARNTKDRVTYNQLNLTQWVAGFCLIMREKMSKKNKKNMLDYFIALLDDSNDFCGSLRKLAMLCYCVEWNKMR